VGRYRHPPTAPFLYSFSEALLLPPAEEFKPQRRTIDDRPYGFVISFPSADEMAVSATPNIYYLLFILYSLLF
jgi:hypothetical protein